MVAFNVTVQSGSQPSEADFTGVMAAVPQAAEEPHIATARSRLFEMASYVGCPLHSLPLLSTYSFLLFFLFFLLE